MNWEDRIEDDDGLERESQIALSPASSWEDRIEDDVDTSGNPDEFNSAVRGVASAATYGFLDELGGAAEAAGSIFGVRGLGSPDPEDIRFSNEEDEKQKFQQIYKSMRDRRRGLEKVDKEINPKSYMGGQIAGGLATSVLPIMKVSNSLAGSMVGGAGSGLLFGAGDSEKDLLGGDYEGLGEDILSGGQEGAIYGAIGHGLVKTLGALADEMPSPKPILRRIASKVSALTRGFGQGKNETPITQHIAFIETLERLMRGVKGSYSELKESNATLRELRDLAIEARKAIMKPSIDKGVVGSVLQKDMKIVNSLTDEEALITAILDDGDNVIKRWLAEKSAIEFPGQMTKDMYSDVLNIPTDARKLSRHYDRKKSAKEFKPLVQDIQTLFEKTRDNRFDVLQDAAMKSFTTKNTGKVLSDIESAISDASKLKSIPTSIKNHLIDVQKMLKEGVGTKHQRLTEGVIEETTAPEHFKRLQKARELLDSKINWATVNKDKLSEDILYEVRNSIDDALKFSPAKLEADDLYRLSKAVEKKFFGVAEFREADGVIDVDEFKLATLLGDGDRAGRFRNALEEFDDFSDKLGGELKTKAKNFIGELRNRISIMNDKRKLHDFRYRDGVSSPAVQRMESIQGKNSIVSDAVKNPAGFLNSADEMVGSVVERIGKPFSQFSTAEKKAVVKIWTWRKNNASASPKSVEEYINLMLPNLQKKDAIDSFLNN